MIPRQLTLKNFLSYRDATLDFRGLHVACICGPNGAGKSSLLEAIAWALWGQSRVAVEDDVVHLGAHEAQVDFIFDHQQQTYRVLRSRRRRQATTLEFQVETPDGFRSLTERGIRATQQLILQHLRLDYETFINSAYLRQGRADEFMLKRPSDRKQILADLLKLNQYDTLAEQAKEHARQCKAQVSVLEQTLKRLEQQLLSEDDLQRDRGALETAIAHAEQQQREDQAEIQRLQALQQQQQTWQQQLELQRQQHQHLQQDCQRLTQDLTAAEHQAQELDQILAQEAAIAQGYARFQQLQAEEEQHTQNFQAHQSAQAQRSQLQQQQNEHLSQLKAQLQQAQTSLEALQQEEQDIQRILSKAGDIESALEQLRQARQRLTHLDQLQVKVAPLMQRRQQIQSEIDRAQTRIRARLDELQASEHQLQLQQERQPQLAQAVLDIADKLESLEKRRIYQQRVREKGLERRSFMERLQAHQRDYETQIAQLDQKMKLLSAPDALCPLCDRPLDTHHWQLVQERHQTQRQTLHEQIWVIREQLAVSEREIQILRREYRELEQELAQYGSFLERRGQLQEQLHVSEDVQIRLQQIAQEQVDLTYRLEQRHFALDAQEELNLIDQSLAQLTYDERDHALARGQVDRLRWAEIKQAELKQAQRRQAQFAIRGPELAAAIADLEAQIAVLTTSPLQQQIDSLDRQIAEISYDFEHHNQLQVARQEAQVWQLRFQELQQAQQQHPLIQQRIADLKQVIQERSQAQEAVAAQIAQLQQCLEQTPDPTFPLQTLERQIQARRSQRDQQLAQLGQLQQQQQQLESIRQHIQAQQHELTAAQQQARVYRELAQAFGKNGIQALMIENVLPQLEAETNQILSRLSANQLHVQFVTQRTGRRSSKLIDTLDILIADARGTRPYETYSGGEAFRVNFAIRLALARLLAQQSGTALQLLIVDEGFGTQDAEGCDRLIASINAIAADFACILMVTHVPHFREAFQTRIDVSKTVEGSSIKLSV